MQHLVDWAYALLGRSGVGMDGAAPLSFREIEAWARLTGEQVEPYEAEAVTVLDAVLRYPETGEEEVQQDAEPEEVPAWPTRKTIS